METGKVINKISNRLRRRSKKIQESIGISGAKGNILNYILVESENHPVYQKEIEEEFGLRPSTATETLKNLVCQTGASAGKSKEDCFYRTGAED